MLRQWQQGMDTPDHVGQLGSLDQEDTTDLVEILAQPDHGDPTVPLDSLGLLDLLGHVDLQVVQVLVLLDLVDTQVA
jgi:hypothetical protein